MHYIDTHFHANNENIEIIIEEALNNSVDKLIISGSDLESNYLVDSLTRKYDNLYGVIGYHPNDVTDLDKDAVKLLEKLLENKKIVGIGEIGLDYYYTKEQKEIQKEFFIKQLDLAKKYDLPVVIHSRDSFEDTYNILKKYELKGVIHCFSYSLEASKLFTSLGYYLGIGGVVTFKNSKTLVEVVKNTDISKIVFETDSPYLSPEPFRGSTNSPKNIPIISKKVANIKEISEEKITDIIYKNSIELFSISE